MSICRQCGTTNETHYRFCLGCGQELVDAAPPPTGSAPVDPYAMTPASRGARALAPIKPRDPAAKATPTPAQALAAAPTVTPAAPAARSTRSAVVEPPDEGDDLALSPDHETRRNCPRCGWLNPVTFQFCGSCGLNLEGDGTGSGYAAVPGYEAEIDAMRPTDPDGPPIAQLSLLLPDGSAGGSYTALGPVATIGRGSGPLFDQDPYLSPQHLRLSHNGEQLTVADAGSLNGVFLRITQEPLQDGDVFRMGQELLRFNLISGPRYDETGTDVAGSPNPGFWGRLSLMATRRTDGSAFPLFGEETVLGRERGDILFFDDGYVSGRHAKVCRDAEGLVVLMDLGSSNGTFIRLKGPRIVPYGSMLVLGQQLFRLDTPL